MLLYATRPVGAVVGHCVAKAVVRASAERLWTVAGAHSAMTAGEFACYLDDAPAPGAIEIVAPHMLSVPLPLRFRPPQSWMWLLSEERLHVELLHSVTTEA